VFFPVRVFVHRDGWVLLPGPPAWTLSVTIEPTFGNLLHFGFFFLRRGSPCVSPQRPQRLPLLREKLISVARPPPLSSSFRPLFRYSLVCLAMAFTMLLLSSCNTRKPTNPLIPPPIIFLLEAALLGSSHVWCKFDGATFGALSAFFRSDFVSWGDPFAASPAAKILSSCPFPLPLRTRPRSLYPSNPGWWT